MRLSQGFTAEGKEKEGADAHGSGSFTEIQHQQQGWWFRVLGEDGAAASPNPHGQPHPCVILQPWNPTEGLLTVICSVNF